MKTGRGDLSYARGGVVPAPLFERGREAYPMLRYPWAEARAALVEMADRADIPNESEQAGPPGLGAVVAHPDPDARRVRTRRDLDRRAGGFE